MTDGRLFGLLVWAALFAAALLVSSCGEDDGGSATPGMGASVDMKLPWSTPTDWVSYAQQVSLVTVTAEKQLEFRPEVKEHGEGYVGRIVTVSIGEPIWVAPEATPVTGEQQWDTFGWLLKDGELLPFGGPSRWEVGRTYLVPIAWYRHPSGEPGGEFGSMVPDGIPVKDGRLPDDLSYLTPWLRELESLSVNEVAAKLRATPVDPLALQFWHLREPEQRWAAVKEARQTAGAQTATAGVTATPTR